jgi:hypothetical protein
MRPRLEDRRKSKVKSKEALGPMEENDMTDRKFFGEKEVPKCE